MHDIEAELTKALKLKKKFDDRQKLLNTILIAMDDRDRFTDDDYDNLSDEAAAWHKVAVDAKGNDEEIPDFDEDTGEVDNEAEEGAEDEDDSEEADDASEEPDAEADDDDDEPEAAEADDEITEDENGGAEEDSVSDAISTVSDAISRDSDNVDEESEDSDRVDEAEGPEETEEQVLKKAKKIAKQAPKPTPVKAKPKQKELPLPKAKGPKTTQQGTFPEPDYENLDHEKRDRFGHVAGTKTAEAIKMFQKGASNKQVKERLGDTYYNLLKKLQSQGHSVEKEGPVFTLFHKDDLPKKKAK